MAATSTSRNIGLRASAVAETPETLLRLPYGEDLALRLRRSPMNRCKRSGASKQRLQRAVRDPIASNIAPERLCLTVVIRKAIG